METENAEDDKVEDDRASQAEHNLRMSSREEVRERNRKIVTTEVDSIGDTDAVTDVEPHLNLASRVRSSLFQLILNEPQEDFDTHNGHFEIEDSDSEIGSPTLFYDSC